ncbi:MAG: hypothetical protein QM710_03990 [Flavobacterium sp.]
MKKLKMFLGFLGLFAIVMACSDDSGSSGNQMKVFAKATYDNNASRISANKTNATVALTDFRINVREVTLKYKEADDDNDQGEDDKSGNNGNGYQDITVSGPWELDLLNQTTAITTINVPNGTYKKAELQLSKSLVATSPIFGKTVEIKGTINDTPFVFWHDFDQRLKLNYENDPVVISNNSFDLVFSFDLNQLVSMLDLDDAVDGNGNGIIEIGPNDTDGNNALAQLLNQHIGGCGGIEHHNHH